MRADGARQPLAHERVPALPPEAAVGDINTITVVSSSTVLPLTVQPLVDIRDGAETTIIDYSYMIGRLL